MKCWFCHKTKKDLIELGFTKEDINDEWGKGCRFNVCICPICVDLLHGFQCMEETELSFRERLLEIIGESLIQFKDSKKKVD